jgi:hypothetical protein
MGAAKSGAAAMGGMMKAAAGAAGAGKRKVSHDISGVGRAELLEKALQVLLRIDCIVNSWRRKHCRYCSRRTYTAFILHSYCTHTALILHSYSTHTAFILHSYSTHTSLILYSYPARYCIAA